MKEMKAGFDNLIINNNHGVTERPPPRVILSLTFYRKDLEIKKYKETLAKMQKQWEQAIEATDKDKNKKQVDLLKEELKEKEALVLNLKKDNQTLKLKIHASDEEHKDIPAGENENISKISLERIK